MIALRRRALALGAGPTSATGALVFIGLVGLAFGGHFLAHLVSGQALAIGAALPLIPP